MTTTLERLYERRATLLKVIHSAEITPSDAKTSTLVHNDRVRRDAEKELFEVQALIDEAQIQ